MQGLRSLGEGRAACALFFALLLCATTASAQVLVPQLETPVKKPAAGKTPPNAAGLSSIKIVEESKYRQVINVARDCIKDKDWPQAVKALQALLDSKEDHYVQVRESDTAGQSSLRWTSVKFEANNLLGAMPIDGLEAYEVAFGARAQDLLDEAKKAGERDALAEIAHRYCHTRAGIEANELLATIALARGQHFMAALRFEKLLAMPAERSKLTDMTLYKAALAFHRAGNEARAEAVWKQLEPRLKDAGGLQAGERIIGLAHLHEVLRGDTRIELVNGHDWLMVRGNVSHTAQATGSPPLLDRDLWRRPLLNAPFLTEKDNEPQAKLRVDNAMKELRDMPQPILPGFFPVATGGLMIYRGYGQINAVYLRETRDSSGELHQPGEIAWRSLELEGGLPALLDSRPGTVNAKKDKIEVWLNQYHSVKGFSSLLFENSTIGTLSSDHKCIYAIDDLAVPPPGMVYNAYGPVNMQPQGFHELREYVMRNNLIAYHLQSGKIDWDTKDEKDFSDSHFLGVPISVGGKLYVLNEKNPQTGNSMGDSELRLVCIDPSKRNAQNRPSVVAVQPLGLVQQQHRVANDWTRRVNAVHLAYGDGILVCPTNAGEVFGIDLMTRSLVWSYPYRESSPGGTPLQTGLMLPGAMPPGAFPGRQPTVQLNLSATTIGNWKPAPPAVADGKIVFTAPDANSVHCINLRDGTPVWKLPRQDGDLYLAGVYQGRVLVVGKSVVRAYNLKDGAPLWKLHTGDFPSGQGVASKNVYYLPLQKGEILAIDTEKGVIKAHNRSADSVTPGNLVFHDGAVLSQTATEVAAYPQLVARLELAKREHLLDPTNLDKGADYGEMLLKDGQVQAAVDELTRVAVKGPPGELKRRVNDRLFEGLTDLMQHDFAGASKRYLAEFKLLTDAVDNDQERQQRLAKFYRIVGQGREAQGDLVEAFRMYKDFGALPLHREQGGVAAADDPNHKVPTHVWLRGRISAMIERASDQQREPLEKRIEQEWRAVEAKNDPDAIRSFVGMFDVAFRVGRAARVRLAEVLMARNDRPAFLEAELYLEQLLAGPYRSDPASGGRALAALALLEEKKGTGDSMKLAAAYYRTLARDFAKDRVRQDQTGADLLSELASDKRFLPFLEEIAQSWGPAPLKVRELGVAGAAAPSGGFLLSPVGDQTPFARRHRLAIDRNSPANPTVRLIDVATGRERWAKQPGHVPENIQINTQLYQQATFTSNYHPNARYRFFHVKGHLLVFQVGVMVYCYNGDTGDKLWEQTTIESLKGQPNLMPQPGGGGDPEGNPEFILWNQLNNQRARIALGQVGAVEASYVALLTQKGLVVNDPLRGTLLWSRAVDIPGARLFGDEQHVYLVEGEAGGASTGRVLRASDGEQLNVPDFAPVYQQRVRVLGRRILAALPTKTGLALKLYDILTGKDDWSKTFPAGSTVCVTEDRDLTGVIEPGGRLVALEVATGKELLAASLLQGRNVTVEDVKNLKDPLLLRDRDHYYVALNHPIDDKRVAGGLVHNNFSNGLRCAPSNGWFLALHRTAGERASDGQVRKHTAGQLAWDSFEPIQNQSIVLEQFDELPVLIFSSRYSELINGGAGGTRAVWDTRSFDRISGSLLYPLSTTIRQANTVMPPPQFASFVVDPRAGTITLQANGSVNGGVTIQHYVDDGRAPAPAGAARAANPPAPRQAPAIDARIRAALEEQRLQRIRLLNKAVPPAP